MDVAKTRLETYLFYNSYNLVTVFLTNVETWWQLDLVVQVLGQSMLFCHTF